jgi:hypothetical protein
MPPGSGSLHDRAASAGHAEHEHHNGGNEQQVNEGSDRVSAEHAEQPDKQEYDRYRQQHFRPSFLCRSRRRLLSSSVSDVCTGLTGATFARMAGKSKTASRSGNCISDTRVSRCGPLASGDSAAAHRDARLKVRLERDADAAAFLQG